METQGRSAAVIPEFEADRRRMELHIPDDCMSLQIQTTTACNARCRFCPHARYYDDRHPGMMTESLFLRILEEVRDKRFFKVMPYLQNEPLCDPRIFRFLREMKQALSYHHIEMSVNPAALTHHAAVELAEVLADTPHEIRISFHGIDEDSLARNMGLSFSPALEHVMYFLSAAGEMDLTVMIKGLGTPRSEGSWNTASFTEREFLDFWDRQFALHRIRTDHISLRYGMFHNRSDYVTGIREERRIIRQDLQGFYCSRVDKWYHFLHDGSMILCCNDYNRETVFGSIEHQGLQEILQGETYRRLAGQVTGLCGSPPDFICKRCASVGG